MGFEFDGSILSGETPLDGHRGLIAPFRPGSHLLRSDLQNLHEGRAIALEPHLQRFAMMITGLGLLSLTSTHKSPGGCHPRKKAAILGGSPPCSVA
jgi:hypothetical protein